MSTQQKVRLVRSVVEQFGTRSALTALQLPRSTWYYHRKGRPD